MKELNKFYFENDLLEIWIKSILWDLDAKGFIAYNAVIRLRCQNYTKKVGEYNNDVRKTASLLYYLLTENWRKNKNIKFKVFRELLLFLITEKINF